MLHIVDTNLDPFGSTVLVGVRTTPTCERGVSRSNLPDTQHFLDLVNLCLTYFLKYRRLTGAPKYLSRQRLTPAVCWGGYINVWRHIIAKKSSANLLGYSSAVVRTSKAYEDDVINQWRDIRPQQYYWLCEDIIITVTKHTVWFCVTYIPLTPFLSLNKE